MPRRLQALDIRPTDRRTLEAWVRAGTTPQRVVKRAQIVLLAGDHASARAIARLLHVRPRTVMLWRARYQRGGPESLRRDAPGRGRRPTIDSATVVVVRELMASVPAQGGLWSIRRLAQATGLSRASVHRIVRAVRDHDLRGRTRKRHTFPDSLASPELPT